MASILSAEDQTKVNALTGSGGYHWIGHNDRATEGTFVWSDSAVSFRNWFIGEPNNYRGEDCTHVNYGKYGELNDLPCSSKIKSVCKIPGQSSKYQKFFI